MEVTDDMHKLAEDLTTRLANGEKLDNRQLKSIADGFGVNDAVYRMELSEVAVRKVAHSIAEKYRDSPRTAYDAIIDLYNRQPRVELRTSNRMMMQQYSTPVYIGYLMSLYVSHGQSEGFSVFEPTAGNGFLTVGLPESAKMTLQELDKLRFECLEKFMPADAIVEYGDATNEVGMRSHINFDSILANPPFGRLDEPYELNKAMTLNDIDHLIALLALSAKKLKGRAAIIVGGHTEWDAKGRITAGKNRKFLDYLYRFYEVEDVININGDMYARQGTTFPIRLILIKGGAGGDHAPLKSDKDKTVETPDELFKRVYAYIGGAEEDDTDEEVEMRNAVAVAQLQILALIKINSPSPEDEETEEHDEPEETDDSDDDTDDIDDIEEMKDEGRYYQVDEANVIDMAKDPANSFFGHRFAKLLLLTDIEKGWMTHDEAVEKAVADMADYLELSLAISEVREALQAVKGDMAVAIPKLVDVMKKNRLMEIRLEEQKQRILKAYNLAKDHNVKLGIARKMKHDIETVENWKEKIKKVERRYNINR